MASKRSRLLAAAFGDLPDAFSAKLAQNRRRLPDDLRLMLLRVLADDANGVAVAALRDALSERYGDHTPRPKEARKVLLSDLQYVRVYRRMRAVFRQLGANTVADLAAVTEEQCRACRGCGVGTLNDIHRILNCFGMTFRPE